jgi:hypothetical protein
MEIQYSTPCFSFAAVTLVVRGPVIPTPTPTPRPHSRTHKVSQGVAAPGLAPTLGLGIVGPGQVNGWYNASYSAGLLADAELAIDAALTALAFGQPVGDQGCAQGHCNFYT